MPVLRFGTWGPKQVFWLVFGLMTLLVIYIYEVPFLDPESQIWQHFARVTWWLVPHGVLGGIALIAGPLQFSSRLRRWNLRFHRLLGRIYLGCVLISAPTGIYIAIVQGPPELIGAATIQSLGWIIATGIAIYCVRNGNVQQHREWMIRGYPFAMVFVAARVILAIPAVQVGGNLAVITVVWSCVAAAGILPSFVIEWRAILRRKASAVS